MLFISNIVFARESGYFDAAPFDKWLLHTWSLSVEWQFYIVYPVAVVLARLRLSPQRIKYLIVAACISFAMAVYATTRWPTFAFYLLPTRAWEMLAGAIVYLYPMRSRRFNTKALEVAGLIAIVGACLYFDHTSAWPGYRAAVPVIGTMMVLWAQQTESFLTSNRLSTFLGKISYSVYLWHWPVVVAVNYFDVARNAAWCALGILASIGLGWVSYRLIESARWQPTAGKLAGARGLMKLFFLPVVVASVAFGILRMEGVPGTVRAINSSARGQFVAAYRVLHETGLGTAYRQECDFYNWNTRHAKTSIASSCTAAGGPDATLLWGDSHAQSIGYGVKALVGNAHLSQVATSACPPGFDGKTTSPVENNCALANQFAMSRSRACVLAPSSWRNAMAISTRIGTHWPKPSTSLVWRT